MATTRETLDTAALEAAASAVPDPELPVVTLGDLGIVRGVEVLRGGVDARGAAVGGDAAAVVRGAAAGGDREVVVGGVATVDDREVVVRGAAAGGDGSLVDENAALVVEVRLTPTFVGCPATEVIAADVRAAVSERLHADGATDVEVRTRMVMAPAWSTDWISDDGRRKLAEHGIAPPRAGQRGGGGPVVVQLSAFPPPNPPTQPNRTQPRSIAQPQPQPQPPTDQRPSSLSAQPQPGSQPSTQPCPRCASVDTREISAFGSTPCQSLRVCRACGEPFGAMKSL